MSMPEDVLTLQEERSHCLDICRPVRPVLRYRIPIMNPFAAFLLAASLNGQTPGVQPYSISGAFLVEKCQAVAVENPSIKQTQDSDICLSYIEGFIDGRWYSTLKFTCLSGVSYPEMVTGYLAYMKKNPQYLRMSKHYGLEAALLMGFRMPCSAK